MFDLKAMRLLKKLLSLFIIPVKENGYRSSNLLTIIAIIVFLVIFNLCIRLPNMSIQKIIEICTIVSVFLMFIAKDKKT